MPHAIAIAAVVTKPNGKTFYKGSHDWGDEVDDQAFAWFQSKLDHLNNMVGQVHGKKEDDANLTAVLSATIDGQAFSKTFTGVTRAAVSKVEREFHNITGELITVGEDLAAKKAHGKGAAHGKP